MRMPSINYIYLLQFKSGVKVGIARRFEERFRSYSAPWCQPVLKKVVIKTEKAAVIERCIKRIYRSYTNSGSKEYFYNVSFDTILEQINHLNKNYTLDELIQSKEGSNINAPFNYALEPKTKIALITPKQRKYLAVLLKRPLSDKELLMSKVETCEVIARLLKSP